MEVIMAFVPGVYTTPRRARKGSRAAVGPQAPPNVKTAKRTTPKVNRVTEDAAATRLSRVMEPASSHTTSTKSERKRLRTDKRGNSVQTEFMPAREKERLSKIMGNASHTIDEHYPQTRMYHGPAIVNASFSNGSHEPKDYAPPQVKQNVNIFPPVDEFIHLQQTGKNTLKSLFKDQPDNSFRLENYGPNYAANEMDPNIDVTGVTLPLKSTCGYNRTGVFNPLAFYDWAEQSTTSVYTESSFTGGAQNAWAVGGKHALTTAMVEVIKDWYEAADPANVPSDTQILDNLITYAEGLSSTSSFTFPVQEINETYTFRNENSLGPCYISLYHCTPKQRLGRKHNPITDWYDFQLGGGVNQDLTDPVECTKADSNLAFPPQFSQYQNNFATISKNSTVEPAAAQVDSWHNTKYKNVTSISTEVVPQNTPFQSQVFRNHWEVINNKKILLQPGQELKIHVKISFARPLDVREILLGDASFYYEALTYYPIIKFWGGEDIGQIKPKHYATGFQYNRLREIVKPASTPCLLVASKQGSIKVAGKLPPEMKSNFSQPASFNWLNNFFGSFTGTVRQFSSPYIDLHEYGVSMPYINSNNNYLLIGLKATDIDDTGADPAVLTYFGFNSSTISTDWSSFSATSIEPYLAKEIAAQIFIVAESTTTSEMMAPQLINR